MVTEKKDRTVKKAAILLDKHEAALIKELGSKSFDLLTPKQTADRIDIPVGRLGDLVRQGWLASIPELNAGSANLYYRWRVEFVKRYRAPYGKRNNHT
jgi:hypothetical protein